MEARQSRGAIGQLSYFTLDTSGSQGVLQDRVSMVALGVLVCLHGVFASSP